MVPPMWLGWRRTPRTWPGCACNGSAAGPRRPCSPPDHRSKPPGPASWGRGMHSCMASRIALQGAGSLINRAPLMGGLPRPTMLSPRPSLLPAARRPASRARLRTWVPCTPCKHLAPARAGTTPADPHGMRPSRRRASPTAWPSERGPMLVVVRWITGAGGVVTHWREHAALHRAGSMAAMSPCSHPVCAPLACRQDDKLAHLVDKDVWDEAW